MTRWVARTTGRGVRRGFPVLVRLTWELVKIVVRLVALAQVTFWMNAPATTNRVANEIVNRAAMAGLPPQMHNLIYMVGRVIAFQLLVIGFILNAYIVVFICNLLF